jgi:hypothetical protein
MATNEAAMDQETAELIASIDACFDRLEKLTQEGMALMLEIFDDIEQPPAPPRESEPAEAWDLDYLLGY